MYIEIFHVLEIKVGIAALFVLTALFHTIFYTISSKLEYTARVIFEEIQHELAAYMYRHLPASYNVGVKIKYNRCEFSDMKALVETLNL